MRELDEATFDEAIAGAPLLVDFWAPWCRPCLALEPIVEQLSGRVPVARLNIDDYPDISARYDVLSIPTLILFSNGVPQGSAIGVRPHAYFESWLDEVLPAGELDDVAVQRHDDA